MTHNTVAAALLCTAGLVGSPPLAAQSTPLFTANIGGGFSEPVYHTDGRVNTGFNVNAGAGINLMSHLGVIGEFGFNRFDLSDRSLLAAGIPGGNTRIYSVTLNPIIHLNPRGRTDAYIIGGGGYYRRTVDFTQPTIAVATVFDPFFFGFVNVPVPANLVLSSFTQNKAGWNVGGGVSFRVKGDSNFKVYAEARYHYIYTTPVQTTILPVTFGLRW